MRTILLTLFTQGLDALPMFCHFLLRPSKFRLCLPNPMSRRVILLDPPADGGSTGRAWLRVEDFGQKMDVASENARITREHFDLSFELGDVKVQYVEVV